MFRAAPHRKSRRPVPAAPLHTSSARGLSSRAWARLSARSRLWIRSLSVRSVATAPAPGRTQRGVVLFDHCQWGAFSAPDPNGKLDAGLIRSVKIGCNTTTEHLRFIVRDVSWVKYAD